MLKQVSWNWCWLVSVWSMIGQCNFIAKAVHLFISMDKMIGGQFEKGVGQNESGSGKSASPTGR
jgi:hypothetical protein